MLEQPQRGALASKNLACRPRQKCSAVGTKDQGKLSLTPVLWAHWPARMVAREGQHTAKLVMSAVVVERVQSS